MLSRVARMALQLHQVSAVQDRCVSSGEDHRRGNTAFLGFFPSVDTQAPPVSRFESRETGSREGGAQIVAPVFGKFQKGIGHLGTDTMPADVVGSYTAVTVP
jgi:hypothetical protein